MNNIQFGIKSCINPEHGQVHRVRCLPAKSKAVGAGINTGHFSKSQTYGIETWKLQKSLLR